MNFKGESDVAHTPKPVTTYLAAVETKDIRTS